MHRLGLGAICGGLLLAGGWPGLAAIAANPAHVERLLRSNQCPQCDLSGADLSNRNLFGANLTEADLSGANLAGSNLGAANLTKANLSGANLSQTYLQQAVLGDTNLSQAQLAGADLQEGVLLGAVDFSGASLRGAKLSRMNLAGVNLQGVDLQGADLSYAVLTGIRSLNGQRSLNGLLSAVSGFTTAFCETGNTGFAPGALDDMNQGLAKQFGFEFALANLVGANLAGANLTGAMVANGNLRQANLRNATLTEACLSGSNLTQAILDGAELKETKLVGAIVAGTSLRGAKNANLANTYVSEAAAQMAQQQKQAVSQLQTGLYAQSTYFSENQTFASTIEDLDAFFESEVYQFEITPAPEDQAGVMMVAVPQRSGYKMYLGFVYEVEVTSEDESNVSQFVCESKTPRTTVPPFPADFFTAEEVGCPEGFEQLEEPIATGLHLIHSQLRPEVRARLQKQL